MVPTETSRRFVGMKEGREERRGGREGKGVEEREERRTRVRSERGRVDWEVER